MIIILLFLYIVILVGFETDLLSVNESAGSVELCVRIFTNPTLFPNHAEINFFLDLISTTGSASKTLLFWLHGFLICIDLLTRTQIPQISGRLLTPTILLWPSPLTPLLIDSVLKSTSLTI